MRIIIIFIFQVVILATSLLFLETDAEYCNVTSLDLSDKEKQRQLSDWYAYGQDWIPNFHLFPALSNRLLKDNETNPDLLPHYLSRTQRLTKAKCKLIPKSRNIMDRSTCPWYLEYSYDLLRYPRILVSANCKCRKCMYTQSHKTVCVPLKVRVKILRRKLSKEGNFLCSAGKAIYENTWETINTACTCVLRRTSKQRSRYARP